MFYFHNRVNSTAHSKRLLRHVLSQRGLPVKAARRKYTNRVSVTRQRKQRDLPTNQSQGQKTGPNTLLILTTPPQTFNPQQMSFEAL